MAAAFYAYSAEYGVCWWMCRSFGEVWGDNYMAERYQ